MNYKNKLYTKNIRYLISLVTCWRIIKGSYKHSLEVINIAKHSKNIL